MLTGRPVDAVSAVHRSEEGWTMCFEVVELERVPASTSVLATFEVEVDGDGAVIDFGRISRYYRNQASEGDS
jgi:Gas vesicle synthesis protein GvpO